MPPLSKPKVEPALAPTSAPAPAPNYATKEDLAQLSGVINSFQQQFGETVATLRSSFDAVAAQRPREEAAPAVTRTVTLEQIDAAYDEGDHKKALRLQAKYNEEGQTELMARFKREHVDPLQNFGTEALGDITLETLKPKMPYYDTYEKEIKDYLSKLPAHLRAHANTVKVAYDAVVGRHVTDILAADREKVQRAATQPKGHVDGGDSGTTGRTVEDDASGVLSLEKVFDTEDAKNIRESLKFMNKGRGATLDEYAQKRGYKDAQAWLANAKKMREGEAVNA